MINKFNSSHFSSFIPYWTYSPSCVLISFFCIFITNKYPFFHPSFSSITFLFMTVSIFITICSLVSLFYFFLSLFCLFYHTSVPFITHPFLLSHFRSFFHTSVPFITLPFLLSLLIFTTETISRTDESQPRPKYIFSIKCETNIYFIYCTEVLSITITKY